MLQEAEMVRPDNAITPEKALKERSALEFLNRKDSPG
jgi:hypothetical protein